MTCFTGDYDGDLRPAAEIEEMAWLTSADRGRLSLVAQIILDWRSARPGNVRAETLLSADVPTRELNRRAE